jgi:hypothetical protein
MTAYEGRLAPERWKLRAILGNQQRTAQCVLLRDIFGTSPRTPTFHPCWQTLDVRRLAQGAQDGARSDDGALLAGTDLPILADALEDAGCANADLLGHLRGPGPHVRGCWALDLILGKS